MKESYVQNVIEQRAQKTPSQHISTNKSMEVTSESVVQTGLTDNFKSKLLNTRNQVDEYDLDVGESDSSLSKVKSLHDYDGKIARMSRAYIKKECKLKDNLMLSEMKEAWQF